MTKTNSTADHFKNYFRFKIYEGKRLAAISAIMGLLSFLQYAVILLVISRGGMEREHNEQLFMFSKIICFIALIAAFGITVYTALSSFDFYVNKHKTDMLGSLPISHRVRFFGDLLSGYIIGVLPFSVVSALSIPFAAAAGGTTSVPALYTQYYGLVLLTVFFTLTFLYAISVLSAAISGRIIGAVACLIVFVAAFETAIEDSVSFFLANITGLDYFDIMQTVEKITPSISDAQSVVNTMAETNRIFLNNQLDPEEYCHSALGGLALSNSVNILVWTVVIVLIIAAAFFLSKFRKAERIGGAFGHKYGYYFILSIVVYTIVINFCADRAESYGFGYDYDLISLVSAIVCAVIFLVFEISMRRGWKNFFIGAGVFAGSYAVVSGMAVLVMITGAFGLRNKLPEVDEISAVEYNDYRFTDKEDIAAFREKHLNILETYKPSLNGTYITSAISYYYQLGGIDDGEGMYNIKYTLKNGDVVERKYDVMHIDEAGKKCKEAMDNIPVGLNSYNDQLLSNLENYNLDSCHLQFKGYIGGRKLKPEKITELIKLLNEEQQGKVVGSSDKRIGTATFVNSEDGSGKNSISIDIYESYTKAIAFITNQNNIVPLDETIDHIYYSFTVGNHSSKNGFDMSFRIYQSEMSDPNVIELLSLLTEEEPANEAIAYITCYDLVTTLYLPKENLERFGELAVEIFKTKLEKANTAAY